MMKAAFFPTLIYAKDLNLDIKLFEKAIMEWSQKDPGIQKTNVKGWHSKTNMHTIPVFKPLVDELYKKGDELKRHKDRPSCEISTTIHLGGDRWPIFIDGTGANTVIDEYKNIHKPDAPKGTKVLLEVGDMLVYSGCELEHWREPLEGNTCAQVFLHYNHVNGPFAEKNRFDKRPMLGIPPVRNI